MRYITIIVGVEQVVGQLPTDDLRSAAQLLAALQGSAVPVPGTAPVTARALRYVAALELRVGDIDGLNRAFAPATVEQEDVNAFFRTNETDKPAKWAGLVEKQDRRRGD